MTRQLLCGNLVFFFLSTEVGHENFPSIYSVPAPLSEFDAWLFLLKSCSIPVHRFVALMCGEVVLTLYIPFLTDV